MPDAVVLRCLVVQLDLVDRRVEPVVVRTQGLEHLPDHLVPRVVRERLPTVRLPAGMATGRMM